MKLNIVTGSSNSLGKSFLEEMKNLQDITIWLSRRGAGMEGIFDKKVDLLQKEAIKKTLFEVLQNIPVQEISSVHLVHTASKIKNEFPDIDDSKYRTLDFDGDGIDDEVFACTYLTFKNTHEALLEVLETLGIKDTPKYLNIIGTLLDKKSREPTTHKSMVRANKLLRSYLPLLCQKDPSYKGICISVGTIATESELAYRKYGEHQYWLKEKVVVKSTLGNNQTFENTYIDTDLYAHNPRYEAIYKDETDGQMTERFKREIGLIS